MTERDTKLEFPPAELLRIDGIAGMHYKCGSPTNTIVIYGIGAPTLPDNGSLPDSPFILERNLDIFVPDYIGYGRSDGDFTPQNCVSTFTRLFEYFRKGCEGKNYYLGLSASLEYNRIIFIGKSFGGTYIPILPRFNSEINELALFYPVVDSKHCGTVFGEETNALFLRSMIEDGYHHLYRGILNPIWNAHLENEDNLSPMDNMDYLKDARLFIAHGKKDKVVDYSHSVEYYEKLLKRFSKQTNQFKLNLYPDGEHNKSTSNQAVQDFLDWLDIKI